MKVKTPECDRALTIQGESQKIGNFLDWLQEQDIQLCSPHHHTDGCYLWGTVTLKDGERKTHNLFSVYFTESVKYTDEKELDCGYHENEEVYIRESFEKLLARYFKIDLDKIESEKQSILSEFRRRNV